MNRLLRISRAWWLAIVLLPAVYLPGLSHCGLIGPDEPRYASIGREMARSGDWITPRLWGLPWFEKPALTYWLTGVAFRLGLGDDLAPRMPVALVSIGFLIFFQRVLQRSFGGIAAWTATLVLGSSALWLGSSFIGTTDLPMSAAFAAAMLLSLDWVATGDRRRLPMAAALMGAAVLAKGLVPLVLALPLAWFGRRHILDWLRPAVAVAFCIVALPWYLLCYWRNGSSFLLSFFWEQHFQRFLSGSLAHGQPLWFYAPVMLAAMLPWTPALPMLVRRSLYGDSRRRFLLGWAVFVFAFFSLSRNKLPSYILPMIPPMAALLGIALSEIRARWPLPAVAATLVAIPIAGPLLPQALAGGVSRAEAPVFEWTWLVPVLLAIAIYLVERRGQRVAALAVLAISIAAGVAALKSVELQTMDFLCSARPLWREIAPERDHVCVESMHRSWRYGLNYYSVTPLPDCSQGRKVWEVTQAPGHLPVLRAP